MEGAELELIRRVRERDAEAFRAVVETHSRALWKAAWRIPGDAEAAGDVDTLAKAARNGASPEVRRAALEGLGVADDPASAKALRDLYRGLADPGDKEKVLDAFLMQGDAETLIELFRAEGDMAMKKKILERISMMDDPEALQVILEVLGDKP